MKRIVVIFFILKIGLLAFAQQKFEYQNTNLTFENRVNNLVSLFTLDEKISQLVYNSPAIPRLGVPEYNWWNECLHGVGRAGYATVFPQSITVAASWDDDLLYRISSAISDEARAKHHEFLRRGKRGIYQGLTFWSPNINIFRDPRWGRGHETYGEDPYLTGVLGTQFVKGLQGKNEKYLKVVATAKHFAVHSGPEPLRHSFNAEVNEIDLHETYLPAFKKLVVDGKVYSVMCAYNQFRDYPCCANPYLERILREEWGFQGYIVSDCGAISDFYKYQDISENAAEASALAVRLGTDLNCGSSYQYLGEAFSKGHIEEKYIDIALKRLFMARMKLGMFDPEHEVPYTQIPFSVNCSEKHNKLALEAAHKSIVLLKNEKDILPLSKNIKTLAVIGPNANNWEALIGNYSGIPKNPVTIYEGLKNKLKSSKILFAEGCHLAEGISNLNVIPEDYFITEDGKPGIMGEYFSNDSLFGKPSFARIDKNIDFYWESESPSDELDDDNFSVRWTGYLLPPVTGEYKIGCWGMPELTIWLDDMKILSHRSRDHGFHREKSVYLKAGNKYKIMYEYRNWHGDGDARLLWSLPDKNMLREAIETATKADAVILVLGLSQRLEGEHMSIEIDGFKGGDRTNLELPEPQRELMEAIKSTGKPIIMVLMNGGPLAVNWAQKYIDGIILAGYPGQQGGNAVANVLFGDYNPAGRLPLTYYKSVTQLPPFEDYNMKGRTYRYFTGEALYPFGYGLSYTTFSYSNLRMAETTETGQPVTVKVTVTNTGNMAGDEVVQLYLRDLEASTPRPIIQLEGFKRIHLNSGESKVVEFELKPEQFSMIGNDGKRIIEKGNFVISVGGGQPAYSESVSKIINLAGETIRYKK
jgi:beta-glucosidase